MNISSNSALSNAFRTVVYIAIVATIMENGNEIFGNEQTILTGIAFLSLFALSAMVVGGLILGQPIMLYLDSKKKEAVTLFIQTVAWLAGFTVLLMLALALSK